VAFVPALDSVRVEDGGETAAGQAFRLTTPRGRYELETPLRGPHQIENVALAVLATEELAALLPSLTPAAIREGVAATRWPGRLESFTAGTKTIWLDGCHNPAGAAALGRFFRRRPPVDLLFAAMEDKDVVGIARELFPFARRVILTAPATERAADPAELRERLAPLGMDTEIARSCAEGLEMLLAAGAPEALVAGSLYLVGEARRILLDRARRPVPA
jgi:dihydrofolate synthase/folylpolyglutamate synthase